MATEHKVTFDFYHVRTTSGKSFSKVLANILTKTGRQRNEPIDSGSQCRLHTAGQSGNLWHGEMIRIRMNNLPPAASLDGDIDDLKLDDNQGIGLGAAFLFDSKRDVVVMQRNKHAISSRVFVRYMSAKGGCGEVRLLPIMSSNVWKRFNNMDQPKKLIVKIAPMEHMHAMKGSRHGVEDIANLSTKIDAPIMEITASIGYKRDRALSLHGVKAFINELLAISPDHSELDKLKIGGKDENNESDEIDLLEEFIAETLSIGSEEVVGENDRRVLGYEARHNAALRAWENRCPELDLLLSSDRETEDEIST